MAKYNIGKLFYEEYYKNIDFSPIVDEKDPISKKPNKKIEEIIKEINEDIKSAEFVEIDKPQDTLQSFEATVLYPGLITGTGITHDSKKIEGGYNLGMHFDYTTGMPIVYGSSVKGVLRQYFVDFCKDKDNEGHKVTEKEAEDLKEAIFEGAVGGKNLPMYKRDVFFDAVITKSCKDGYFLADDSITPHTQGPLKNPVPITMLKIAAGCTLEFRFLLHDSEIDGKPYDKDFKKEVFEEILRTVGIGAKTNVGYGQLKIDKITKKV